MSQTTWIAERGVATGAPIELKTWTYDDASRVLTHEVEDSRGRHVVAGAYGADGLLTSTGTNTTYEWKDLRVARVVFSPLRTNVFFYDAGGRVEQVDYQYGNGRVVEEVDRYQWRADGGLSLASHDLPNVGNIVIYRMTHDGAGRVVRSEYSDDGFEMEARRFMYDAHGRLERIDVRQFAHQLR